MSCPLFGPESHFTPPTLTDMLTAAGFRVDEARPVRHSDWVRSSAKLAVRQGEGDVGAVKETIRRLQEGHALIVYPEGTRSLSGEIEKIQAGVGLIVRRAGVPVVPAVIDGSYDAWPKERKVFRPHSVRAMYGPVMELEGLKASQIVEKIDRTLRSMHAQLRATDPVLSGREASRV